MVEDSKSIKEYFGDDHKRLDSIFLQFQDIKNKDFPKAKEYFKEFMFGLRKHIVWEEDILFPAFEEKTGMKTGPTEVMRMEHRQIKEILESIHHKVANKDTKTSEDEQKLQEILSVHNLKEENILYPAIDNMLSEGEKENIFVQMKNIPEERYAKCCH